MSSHAIPRHLFNENPSSTWLRSHLEEVARSSGIQVPEPDVKAYPDAVYFNYYALGISLLFVPSGGQTSTQTPLNYDSLSLDGMDIFNSVKNALPSKGKVYSRFPLLPMELPSTGAEGEPAGHLKVDTTGQDLVRLLGEPTRKGGGAGPSTGSISIWCEWSKHGVMVEFGGDEARGPQAWERGKDAVWKVTTLFPPKIHDHSVA